MNKENERTEYKLLGPKNGFVTRADVEEILNVKQTRAYMILKKLCDAGELQSVSEGKNTKYVKAN